MSLILKLPYARTELSFLFKSPVSFFAPALFGLIFATMPFNFSYLIIILTISFGFSQYLELAVFIFCLLTCIVFFYSVFAPKECILILLTIISFYFELPYIIPLIVGFYIGITGMFPIVIGIFIWSFRQLPFQVVAISSTDFSLIDLPGAFSGLLGTFISELTSDYRWVFIAFVFCMVVFATHFLSRLTVNYSKDLALVFSLIVIILSYLIGVFIAEFEFNLLIMFFSVLISGFLLRVIMFFDVILDYKRAETVSFQDEDFYYYVRVIPKIKKS